MNNEQRGCTPRYQLKMSGTWAWHRLNGTAATAVVSCDDEFRTSMLQTPFAFQKKQRRPFQLITCRVGPLLRRSKLFATDQRVPASLTKKLDQLQRAWVDASYERMRLVAQDRRKRMRMIRLSQQIDYLQHAQRNLEAVVHARRPE